MMARGVVRLTELVKSMLGFFALVNDKDVIKLLLTMVTEGEEH